MLCHTVAEEERREEKKRQGTCKPDGGSIKTQESRLHAVVDADVGEEEYRNEERSQGC